MMLPSATVIHTPNQTGGRGQRGNSWESAIGKNALFSMLIKKPAVAVARQFAISEAVSLAIVEALSRYADGFSIKWPNDIYHGDRKICGILIEHSIMGASINQSIIGVGINVNQDEFLSDAPNPVSLVQIIGKEVEVDEVMRGVCEIIERRCGVLADEASLSALHDEYLTKLYRKDGCYHEFALPDGQVFNAKIVDVEPTGMFVLENEEGARRSFAFKEVSYVI